MTKRIRLGIDVGGTFTKAIAIDVLQSKIVGKATVPTTHSTVEGVSTGILAALTRVIQENNIEKSEIELISHSTTQAVNALLEGDTSKIGIIGMGVGLEKANVVKHTDLKHIELSPNKHLRICYRFLDTRKYLNEAEIRATISELKNEGAEVLVVSEAFGVDDPSNESYVMENSDIPITAGHELSGIYGLEIRTLTAAINACILPKAINTAKFVESAVQKEKIDAPVMIMKGDGGITDLKTFQDKPILTTLSGPAASVAGALLHLHVLDGVFIEVGGTSTNICLIKDGRPQMRYVVISNHPTCIRSLDVRVAGIAGGSLVRWSGRKITDVGPRSAHIAGLQYSCFADPEELEGGQIVTFSPKEGDPIDYVAVEVGGGKRFAITTTCAANALGLVTQGDYAKSNQRSAELSLSILAERMGVTTEDAARSILEISLKKIIKIIDPLIREYKLSRDRLLLIGAGGGASILVPYLASKLRCQHKIAENAEVISSIGVAAAMIHEQRERTINEPTPQDISSLIEEIKQTAISRGALPESLSIQSEYISDRSLVRVTALGNVNLDIGTRNWTQIDEEQAKKMACALFGTSEGVSRILDVKNYYVFACEVYKKKFFLKSKKLPILVLDRYGRVRLSLDNAAVYIGSPDEISGKLDSLILIDEKVKSENLAPQVHLLDAMKIVDFSSLIAPEHLLKAVKDELRKIEGQEVAAIVKL